MRSDLAAFKELEGLVRNLSEQLAGYRRRALAAEARTRELEQRMAGADGQAQALRLQADQLSSSRDETLQRARDLSGQVVSLEAELSRARAALADAESRTAPGAQDAMLARENAHLRTRLDDARERTTQLGARVRFLRQQVAHGSER